MPEVHVQKQLSDNVLTDEDKAEKIEELRKAIEGKFEVLNLFSLSFACGFFSCERCGANMKILNAVKFELNEVSKPRMRL